MNKNNLKNFITLEGTEGSGKTTVSKILKEKLSNMGYEVIVTREPGGTNFSENIRKIIMENETSIEVEALLFATARVDHIQKTILPALKNNKFVICDRFLDSSIVYQQEVGKCLYVKDFNKYTYENCMPYKTFFLDIKPEISLKRINQDNREVNKFDQKEFAYHEKIYQAYKNLIRENKQRIIPINGEEQPEIIAQKIIENLGL